MITWSYETFERSLKHASAMAIVWTVPKNDTKYMRAMSWLWFQQRRLG